MSFSVDVLANIDSANNYVAISIAVSPQPIQTHLTGVVKSISATQWVVNPGSGAETDETAEEQAEG